MASNLVVLSEDTDILPYLNKNGLYPNKLFFRTSDFCDDLQFADENFVFLVIVHSFTRFTSAELNVLFEDLRNAAAHGATPIILSDILVRSPVLKNSNIQFVQYEGDLFFGRYTGYSNNKAVWSAPDEGLYPEAPNGKNCDAANRTKFWAQFAEFTTERKTMIGEKPSLTPEHTTSDTKYLDTIIDIDLYS